jgi:HK97 family phage prohead protease
LNPLTSEEIFTPTAGGVRERRKVIDTLNKGLEIICKADNRFIIGGYASVEIVDQEKNRIPIPALRTALKDFMRDARYRNINLVHSNIQVGTVMDKFVAPDGHIYKTMVDDLGLYVVAEIRDDIQIARQVKKMILDGELRSFSISGSVLEKMPRYEKGKTFWDITKLELYEITLCRAGVNQLAKFDVLYVG